MTTRRAAALAAAIAYAVAIAVAGYRMSVASNTLMGDFRAFYCAGRVTLAHGDPYAVAPMAACESKPVAHPLFRTVPPMEVPAPLPGYLVAAFIPFALLPYTTATVLWFLLLTAAGLLSCLLLMRLGWISLPTALVAFAIPLFVTSLPVGELPPIALVGILIATLATRAQRPWLMLPGIVLSMAEPQIGIPLAIAIAFADRRAGLLVAGTAIVLAMISYATLGWNTNVEYVLRFAPAHIASELPRVQQFTIGWIIHQLGASNAAALAVGRIAYAAVLIASGLLGRALAKAGNTELACVLIPVLALLGGPFVHLDHLLLAMPAALWCARQYSMRTLGVFSTVALALPLASIFTYALLIFAVPIVGFAVGREYLNTSIAAVRTAGASMLVAVVVFAACSHYGFGFVSATAASNGSSIAQRGPWSRYVLAHNVVASWTIWTIKAPIWAALVTILLAGRLQGGRNWDRG